MVPTPALTADAFEEDELDGRRLRAARNREAVVAAVLEIIQSQGGGPIPGAAEVADRAGVSERTVFRHFADLDSLFLAAANHQRPVLTPYLTQRPDARELDKRIAVVVRLRSRMYEQIGPVRRVAVQLAAEHAAVARVIAEADRAGRAQLADVFETELRNAGRDKSLVLDQLELATSWSNWQTARLGLRASPERARRIMTAMMTAVLAPYARRSRR